MNFITCARKQSQYGCQPQDVLNEREGYIITPLWKSEISKQKSFRRIHIFPGGCLSKKSG